MGYNNHQCPQEKHQKTQRNHPRKNENINMYSYLKLFDTIIPYYK